MVDCLNYLNYNHAFISKLVTSITATAPSTFETSNHLTRNARTETKRHLVNVEDPVSGRSPRITVYGLNATGSSLISLVKPGIYVTLNVTVSTFGVPPITAIRLVIDRE